MELNDDTLTAEAYQKLENGVTFVKVKFFGLYLNSINVRESPRFPERGLWVQLPKFRRPGSSNWNNPIMPIERNPNGGLWRLIERKCQEAAANYDPDDVVVRDIPDDYDIETELARVFDDV